MGRVASDPLERKIRLDDDAHGDYDTFNTARAGDVDHGHRFDWLEARGRQDTRPNHWK
jgi:hypothetical protein